MRQTATLANPQQAHAVMSSLWASCIKPALAAGQRLVVEVKPETRSNAENNLLHALIDEISRKLEWAGKKRDPETWKRLLVAAWCRVHGESVEILPALDGHGVDIVPARTSKLSRKECADLIEYVYAWGADQGVEWTDPEERKRLALSAA
jgi:hypothetical protein